MRHELFKHGHVHDFSLRKSVMVFIDMKQKLMRVFIQIWSRKIVVFYRFLRQKSLKTWTKSAIF